MTWTTSTTPCGARAEILRVVDAEGRALSIAEVVALLRDDAAFRRFFGAALAASRFEALFWEMPPITRSTLTREFEAALLDAPALAKVFANPAAFADRFAAAPGDDVLEFSSLGGDAVLVVPAPSGKPASYAHLAAFLRKAPAPQVDRLWSRVAHAIDARLSAAPLWVSTAGLGVPWLHVRLDSKPKYYRHLPYKHAL